jgi:hypothetical protein
LRSTIQLGSSKTSALNVAFVASAWRGMGSAMGAVHQAQPLSSDALGSRHVFGSVHFPIPNKFDKLFGTDGIRENEQTRDAW